MTSYKRLLILPLALFMVHCVGSDVQETKQVASNNTNPMPDMMGDMSSVDMFGEDMETADDMPENSSDMPSPVDMSEEDMSPDMLTPCMEDSCDQGQWCDETDGTCKDGCAKDTQCGAGEACNVSTHDCECADGYVLCDGACLPEDAEHCGASCQMCDAPENGDAMCVEGMCDTTCDAGFLTCGGRCEECPMDENAAQFTCSPSMDACVVYTCKEGFEVCSQGCCALASAPGGSIDPELDYAHLIDLKLDSHNRPYMAYIAPASLNINEGNVMYLYWDGMSWQKHRNLDYPQHARGASDVALELSSSNEPSISYVAIGNSSTYRKPYITTHLTGTVWQETSVGASNYVYHLDSTYDAIMNRVGVVFDRTAYNNNTVSYHIEYAERQGSILTPVVEISEGEKPQVVFDSQGRPHVVFIEFETISTGALAGSYMSYAYRNQGIWNVVRIDDDYARAFHIEIDHQDTVHLVYFDDDVNELRYTRKLSGSNSFGDLKVVASGNLSSDQWFDLDVDSSGMPHIVYRDVNKLAYTHWTGGDWETSDITISGMNTVNGSYISLELDSFDHPHVAYRTSSDGRLMYLRWNGALWIDM